MGKQGEGERGREEGETVNLSQKWNIEYGLTSIAQCEWV